MKVPKGRAQAIGRVIEIYNKSKTSSRGEHQALKKWLSLCVTPDQIREVYSRALGKLKKKAYKKWENMVLRLLGKATTVRLIQVAIQKAPYPSDRVTKLARKKLRKLGVESIQII